MKYGYIYEITNNINGKKYVGKRVGFIKHGIMKVSENRFKILQVELF